MSVRIPPGARDSDRRGLSEFETGSETGLAPFEDESAVQLDEFSTASPNLLDEFDEAVYFAQTSQQPEEENVTRTQDEPLGPPDKEQAEEEPVEAEETSDETAPEKPEGEPEEEERPLEEEKPAREEPEPVPEPARQVIGFVCEHALDLAGVTDAHGTMIGREKVHLIGLPCAGMVKPGWIRLALEHGASGAFIVGCAPGSCHHRTGSCILEGRWHGLRRPMLPSRCDRNRLELFLFLPAARQELLEAVDSFLAKLARLDASAEPERESIGAGGAEDHAGVFDQPI